MSANALLEDELDELDEDELEEPALNKWQNPDLPTMYDLPSEDPEEPGLPDDFHSHQPQLLSETFRPPNYSQVYLASDLNLYYDVDHTQWYKRPDWFAVLGVPPVSGPEREMRYSYVIWQEQVVPFVVVELLSDSTELEDLGKTWREVSAPPTKWEVYEQILKIPYYIVFSRKTDKWQVFKLQGRRYHELSHPEGRFWFPQIQLGLGLWSGTYHAWKQRWLRWYDQNGWIPTQQERAEAAKQRAEAEKQRAEAEKQRAEAEKQRANIAEQHVETAFEEGEQKGQQEGRLAEKQEIARNMLGNGISPAIVAKTTGLTINELAILAKS